jgi:formate-dependent nitrite reductase membrane component NrfD
MKRTKRRAWRVLAIFASVIGLIRLTVDLVSLSPVLAHLLIHLASLCAWMSHNVSLIVDLGLLINFLAVLIAIRVERRRNDKRYVKSRAAASRRQRKRLARNRSLILAANAGVAPPPNREAPHVATSTATT